MKTIFLEMTTKAFLIFTFLLSFKLFCCFLIKSFKLLFFRFGILQVIKIYSLGLCTS